MIFSFLKNVNLNWSHMTSACSGLKQDFGSSARDWSQAVAVSAET